jgi:hypothetical protein
MKKFLLLPFFTLNTKLINCQNTTWHIYDLDNLILIDKPGDAIEMDTTHGIKNEIMKQINVTN